MLGSELGSKRSALRSAHPWTLRTLTGYYTELKGMVMNLPVWWDRTQRWSGSWRAIRESSAPTVPGHVWFVDPMVDGLLFPCCYPGAM